MYKMQGSGLQNGDELDRVQYAQNAIRSNIAATTGNQQVVAE